MEREEGRERLGDIYAEREMGKEKFRLELSGRELKEKGKDEMTMLSLCLT